VRLLVAGANGQVGWELARQGLRDGYQVRAFDHKQLDITDADAVGQRVASADVVINAAAYTAVDRAESEPERAFSVNRDGVANVAACCARRGIPLVHLSTDYVFDGSKHLPYLETDEVAPLGIYGRSKEAGEAEVRARVAEHLIVRTSWVYGVHGRNFVKTMLDLGRDREVLSVVADQYGSPTYAADLAGAILKMIGLFRETRRLAWGTYHYCGRGVTTWHGFAEAVFDLAREYTSLKVTRLEAITTADYPTPAKRPANSVLDWGLLAEGFSIRPRAWWESLAEMIHTLFAGDAHR
jgi:dTDP-4-dehydrorhamnose reductase